MIRAMQLIAFAPSADLDRSRSFYVDVARVGPAESGLVRVRAQIGRRDAPSHGASERSTPQPFTVLGWAVDQIDVGVARG